MNVFQDWSRKDVRDAVQSAVNAVADVHGADGALMWILGAIDIQSDLVKDPVASFYMEKHLIRLLETR